jgi:hypothetical protein
MDALGTGSLMYSTKPCSRDRVAAARASSYQPLICQIGGQAIAHHEPPNIATAVVDELLRDSRARPCKAAR